MPCRFCGLPFDKAAGRERTGEHVLPLWTYEVVKDHFGHEGPITHQRHSTGTSGPDQQWQADEWNLVARQVCRECNTGWMNDLEGEVRRYLEPLIRGKRRTLWKHGQTVLAAWSIKTALAVHLTTPEKSATPSHYRDMTRTHRPPKRTQVWLAYYEAETSIADHHSSHLQLSGTSTLTYGYATTMAIGHFVFQVLGYGGVEDSIRVTQRGAWAEASIEIWPPHPTVEWPPRMTLDELALNAFGRVFETPPEA